MIYGKKLKLSKGIKIPILIWGKDLKKCLKKEKESKFTIENWIVGKKIIQRQLLFKTIYLGVLI